MRVKVFQSRRLADLEEKVNAWLAQNQVSPLTTHMQFSSVAIDDSPDSYFLEHTLIVFYMPLQSIS